MGNMSTVILACSSLKDYVEEAQRKVSSSFPVIYLNRIYHRDPKEPGHLYVREKDPGRECFHAIFERLTKNLDAETKERYHNDWKQLYSGIDIMDTGLNDCGREEYREEVQKDADWLEAELSYVPGGTHLLEKLFAGKWDEQFLVLQKGCKAERAQILIA